MLLDPKQILEIADRSFSPCKRYVLFSGGNDSKTLLHWAWNNSPVPIDGALHINTGIGVEETRDFVRKFCELYAIPLIEQRAPSGEYERLCSEYGVPGPGLHWQAYRYLKDRTIESFIAEHCPPKQPKKVRAPIMLITGVYRDESRRRMGTSRPIKYRQNMAQLWVAPIIDWSKNELIEYRELHGLPRNEVADVMHMSMECACGAYGSRSEFEMLRIFYPKVADQIVRCEIIAALAGQKHCTWGERRKKSKPLTQRQLETMDACADCLVKDALSKP